MIRRSGRGSSGERREGWDALKIVCKTYGGIGCVVDARVPVASKEEIAPDWRRFGSFERDFGWTEKKNMVPKSQNHKIEELQMGALWLQEIGALGIGPSKTNWDFMYWYSAKNPVPAIGWLG
jgi:hypothetical protein